VVMMLFSVGIVVWVNSYVVHEGPPRWSILVESRAQNPLSPPRLVLEDLPSYPQPIRLPIVPQEQATVDSPSVTSFCGDGWMADIVRFHLLPLLASGDLVVAVSARAYLLRFVCVCLAGVANRS
jgi:hypothetical protein